MSNSNSSSNSYQNDDDDANGNQVFQTVDPNSSASLDISKLDIQEPVHIYAKRIQSIFNQIQQFKLVCESNRTCSENEENCVRFCEDLLQEHIKSLDQLNTCLNDITQVSDKLDEANFKIRDLERSLWHEKDLKNELKKKFDDDEQQMVEENIRKDKLIGVQQTKLKKLENEKKQLFEEKQDLLLQYQADITKLEKERIHLQLLTKKLRNDNELDELQALNHKNALMNMTHELLTLFNLASSYRRKSAFFGKQFLNTFDLVFGRSKFNSSNVTFLEMPADDTVLLNASTLNLKDITCDELSNFNIILKEKLIQNEEELTIEETIISNLSNSKLTTMLSETFAGNFENRLLGNETFKLASLREGKQHLPAAYVDYITEFILNDLLTEFTKESIIKTTMELIKDNPSLQGSVCKDSIKFIFKPNKSVLGESFQDEEMMYNRFEESYSENLAKNCCPGGNVSGSKAELLVNILNNGSITNSTKATSIDNFRSENNTMIGHRQKQTSEIYSIMKSNNWINSTISHIKPTSRSTSRSSSLLSNSSLCSDTTTEKLMVTINKDSTVRSDGESQIESSTPFTSHDSDLNSMQLTNLNNLSNVFNELSGNQKLNSTVKTDENGHSTEIKFNNNRFKVTTSDLNSSRASSDMQLSEGSINSKIDDCHSSKEEIDDVFDDKSDFSLLQDVMSKDESSYDFNNFLSTIRHESNHSETNMDLTKSTNTNKSQSSVEGISLTTIMKQYDDDTILKENNSLNNPNNSNNSKYRLRKRKSTWLPYFSPLLSFLYLFYPIFSFFKYLSFAIIFFGLFLIFFISHRPAIRVWYSSWGDIGFHLLNLYSG